MTTARPSKMPGVTSTYTIVFDPVSTTVASGTLGRLLLAEESRSARYFADADFSFGTQVSQQTQTVRPSTSIRVAEPIEPRLARVTGQIVCSLALRVRAGPPSATFRVTLAYMPGRRR